jgi:hypothetical protein
MILPSAIRQCSMHYEFHMQLAYYTICTQEAHPKITLK